MSENEAFHGPHDFGCFDLATSQLNKLMVFSWDTQVIAACKIVALVDGVVVKEYTEGNGLVRSNGNLDVTLTLNGQDFQDHVNSTVDFECTFFVQGDLEVIFQTAIIKSHL